MIITSNWTMEEMANLLGNEAMVDVLSNWFATMPSTASISTARRCAIWKA